MRRVPNRVPAPESPVESPVDKRAKDASTLVALAKAGDGRAFEELVRRFRPRIFALALHMTGSRSDADDITQDCFLRAYRKLDQFEGRSEFFTWLYRIALHRALNQKRDRKRRPTMDVDDPRVTVAVAIDAAGDPRRALELRESYALLVAALDRLSPVLRTTIVLTTMQGLSYKEAAVVLETNEGTIAWRVHEARNQMRDFVETRTRASIRPPSASGEEKATSTPNAADILASLELLLSGATVRVQR